RIRRSRTDPSGSSTVPQFGRWGTATVPVTLLHDARLLLHLITRLLAVPRSALLVGPEVHCPERCDARHLPNETHACRPPCRRSVRPRRDGPPHCSGSATGPVKFTPDNGFSGTF